MLQQRRNVETTSDFFVWSFSSHSRIFHSYGDFTIAGEGLQIYTLSYAQRSWPLSSEVSLACHTYTVTRGISEDPWHSYLLPSFWQWSRHYLFSRLRYVTAGIRTPNLPLARRKPQPTAPSPRWNKVGISTLKQRLDVETNVRKSTLKHTSEFQRCNNVSSFTKSIVNVETTSDIQHLNNVRVSTSIQFQSKFNVVSKLRSDIV